MAKKGALTLEEVLAIQREQIQRGEGNEKRYQELQKFYQEQTAPAAAMPENNGEQTAILNKVENNTRVIAEAVKKTSDSITPSPSSPGGTTSEEKAETQRREQEKTVLLRKIEENTRSRAVPVKEGEGDDGKEGGIGGLLGGIFKKLRPALAKIFSPRAILNALGKLALPAYIIGGIAAAIQDGFNEFMKSGDIGETLIKGFGGLLEFISLGFFDAETVRNVVDGVKNLYNDYIHIPMIDLIENVVGAFTSLKDSVSSLYNDYIHKPIINLMSSISDVFTSLSNSISSLFTDYVEKPVTEAVGVVKQIFTDVGTFFTNAFNKFRDMITGIGLPKFTIGPFGIGPAKIGPWEFGPYYPFKGDTGGAESGGAESQVPSESDSLATAAKNFIQSPIDSIKQVAADFNRGTEGTIESQNNYENAINQAEAEYAAEGLDPSQYRGDVSARTNVIANENLDRLNASGAGTSSTMRVGATTALKKESLSGDKGDFSSEEFQRGISSQKSVLGSTLLGALFTKKGLRTGSFFSSYSKSTEGSIQEDSPEDVSGGSTYKNSEIIGRRISGGLFGSDSYTIDDGSEQELKVTKSQYFDIQKLIDEGKHAEAQLLVENIKTGKANKTDLIPLGEMTGEAITSSSNEVAVAARQASTTPIIVNAPTSNNTTVRSSASYAVRPASRNTDSTAQMMQRRSYGYD